MNCRRGKSAEYPHGDARRNISSRVFPCDPVRPISRSQHLLGPVLRSREPPRKRHPVQLFWRVCSPLLRGNPPLPRTHPEGASCHRRACGRTQIISLSAFRRLALQIFFETGHYQKRVDMKRVDIDISGNRLYSRNTLPVPVSGLTHLGNARGGV